MGGKVRLVLCCKKTEAKSCALVSHFITIFVFRSYAKAAFCLEELMMTNPHNHLYCQQYAEVGISEKSITSDYNFWFYVRKVVKMVSLIFP